MSHPPFVALINCLVLLGVTAFVIVGGLRRLITHTPDIHGLSVLVVSLIAMTSMAIAVVILGRDAGSEDLHMRSVLLDTISSDAVASAGVALSGAVIYITGSFDWLDSVMAVLIGIVIGLGALKLLHDVVVALRTGIGLALSDD